MPPHKCAYFRCENSSDSKTMFRFPCSDENRLKIWLNHCGNMTIAHLPKSNLRSRYLCIDHFEEKYIRETGHRKVLRRVAIPVHYRAPEEQDPFPQENASTLSTGSPELKVLVPRRVYVNKRKLLSEEVCIEGEHGDEEYTNCTYTPKRRKLEDTPKCRKLKKILADSTKKLRREKNKNMKLKNIVKGQNVIDLSKHKFRSTSSKIITKMQLRKYKKKWSNHEKKFCMSLYYKSPAAYKFMINSGIILAAPSTIQRWLQETNCLPGINNEIFENIKNKFSEKSIKERSCAVCFDEMSIMVDLEYNSKYDLIEGYEDFGDGDRSNKEAKYALVFIARGLYVNWKIPIAYFLSGKTVDSDKLKIIVDSVINKLFDNGLLPKVTVCDQATTNVKVIKSLGACVDFPFFFINGHKIYSVFDAPHLIKNIRSNLINNDFDLIGSRISFKDVINVYEIDKKNKSKALQKLTPMHINPNNFQKMKVKLATQVLSHSVAGAIKTAIESGELISNTAKHTADFVQSCNDLFDSLNSKNKFDRNPYRCAITSNQNTLVNKMLIKGKGIFTNLKKISYNKNNEIRMTRPPCFDGMIQTINAINQLAAEEIGSGFVKFIITSRFNQDVIENLFGIYRIKGGCNKNPSSKSLRAMFRSNLLNNLMKFEQTNCESDQAIFVSTQQNTQSSSPKPTSVLTQDVTGDDLGRLSGALPSSSVTSPMENLLGTIDDSSQEITLETCSVVYFAGWLGKSCLDKFDCSDCKTILLNNEVDLTDKKQLLLINKTYSNIVTPTLKSPTNYLNQLVNRALDCYSEHIDELYKINLVADLMKTIKTAINFSGDYHDTNHFDYLIKKLLEVKIHDYCKNRKKTLQSASKLRILQNK